MLCQVDHLFDPADCSHVLMQLYGSTPSVSSYVVPRRKACDEHLRGSY